MIIHNSAEVGAEWREFARWPLYAILAFALLLFALAYQTPNGNDLVVDIGAQGDEAFLTNFYSPENNPDKAHPYNYRWSRDLSFYTVPGVGRNVALDLSISMAGRPGDAPPAVITVTVNGRQLGVLRPTGYPPNPSHLQIPAAFNNKDNLVVGLQSNPFSPRGDNRSLGVVVDSINIGSTGSGPGFVRPPTYIIAWLLLSLLLAFLSLSHIRLSRRSTYATTLLLALLSAISLALGRYTLTLFVVQLGVVMICVYLLALVMQPFATWTLRKLKAWGPESTPDMRWLMLIYLLAFAIKAAGMMHPQFIPLDQIFRVHEVQQLVNSPLTFWDKYQHVTTADERGTAHGELQHSMLGQWNLVVPFPYSPVGYFILAPFAWIWPNGNEDKLVTASNTMLAALSSTVVFALYVIAKRGLNSGRAGVIAGAIASFAPITYLHFSDGAYPYIWAGWITVVYLMFAICLAKQAAKPGPFIWLTMLSALTLLSHTAIVFFAVIFVAAAMAVYWLMGKRGLWIMRVGSGGKITPAFSLRPLLLSFLAGGVLSLVYYGGYIWPILTVSLPALVKKADTTGVGLDPSRLGRPLLSGFWPQIELHFTTWPAILALVGLALFTMTIVRSEREIQAAGAAWRNSSAQNEAGADRPAMLVTLVFVWAWAITFLIFSLIDLRVNLLQRHMLFALPLLALLAGYTLARLDRQRAKRFKYAYAPVLALLLIAYLFLVGWQMWAGRVLHYLLPPGSG
ncbi:MAG: hypothetical protein IVW55_07685 [Chloroflexi bacterium]|nr:hypothetical protein [Chloroflexota bacterium]